MWVCLALWNAVRCFILTSRSFSLTVQQGAQCGSGNDACPVVYDCGGGVGAGVIVILLLLAILLIASLGVMWRKRIGPAEAFASATRCCRSSRSGMTAI